MVVADPVNAVPLSKKITKVQNRLFETAHAEPLELKHLGIALNKQGIQGDKLYANPAMLPMPIGRCDYLKSLSDRQKAIISACFYVNLYKLVANSESQTLISNMVAAEKAFEPYSEEYMILHQETSEEMDHIWTFRTVHSMVCRETGAEDEFDSPGFFRGNFGVLPKDECDNIKLRFELTEEYRNILALFEQPDGLEVLRKEMGSRGRAWRYDLIHFLMGEAPRLLSSDIVRRYGLGGLWLLVRFVSNVELKQAESYVFDDLESFNAEPLAYEINQAHLHDEARHYTTSYDIGLAMYRAASEEAQVFIRDVLKEVMEDYIDGAFLTFPELLERDEQGQTSTIICNCRNSLRMALCHPDFQDKQADIDELLKSWKAMPWPSEIPAAGQGLMTLKRWRYTAQQLERLRVELGFEYDRERLGNRLDRYEGILKLETLNQPLPVG